MIKPLRLRPLGRTSTASRNSMVFVHVTMNSTGRKRKRKFSSLNPSSLLEVAVPSYIPLIQILWMFLVDRFYISLIRVCLCFLFI